MKKFLIAGNWKMNTNIEETVNLCKSISASIEKLHPSVEVLVCPPFTNLATAVTALSGSGIKVGAQNCYFEPKGAFTGEISLDMIKNTGAEYVIIGHSERRTIFGETDEIINNKAKAILNHGLKPIICIGETLEERNNNLTFKVLETQLFNAFKDLPLDEFQNITIAYEPVWAIGTGVTATNEQAQEAHSWINNFMINNYGNSAKDMKILYGGSMNDKNAFELLGQENVNGGLIGGASLKAESFVSIINSANKLAE